MLTVSFPIFLAGVEIVLEGLATFINDNSVSGDIDLKCPEGFYCPGNSDLNRCVDVCPPKTFCADPGVSVECPKDKFCPIASTVPLDCEGLQQCKEGLRRPNSFPAAMGVIFAVLIVAVAHLFVVRRMVRKAERKAKQEKTSTVDDGTGEKPLDPNQGGAKKVLPTPPEMTIDIEYTNLRYVRVYYYGTFKSWQRF